MLMHEKTCVIPILLLLRLSNTLSLNLGKSQCGDEASCCCGAWLVDNVHGILRHFLRNSQSCKTRGNNYFQASDKVFFPQGGGVLLFFLYT